MKLGDIGSDVSELQQLLNKYNKTALKVDGHLGPQTLEAVKQVQKRAMLTVDGIAGPLTLAVLRGDSPAPSKPPVTEGLGLDGEYPPFANVMKQKMKERGGYPKGWPFGLMMHYTAGHDGAEKTILGGIKNGYTYWCTERDGDLYVASKPNKWGYHAGESGWRLALKKLIGGVSDDLLGMEINAYGTVKPVKGSPGTYVTYFGLKVDQSVVRYSPGVENQGKGYYHVYTDAQILTYIKTAIWLKMKNPLVFDFDYCLGHDEAAGPSSGVMKVWRKVDPGASLPWTMPKFREGLKKFYVNVAVKPGFTWEQVTMENFKRFV